MPIIKFILKVIAGFFIVIFTIGILIAVSAPSPEAITDQSAELMDTIELHVAEEAEAQYQMVQRSGTVIDMCMQAGMVAAAWLQARDAAKYDFWKDIEAKTCANAGVPR
jgi:hypothetical protein